MRPNLEAPASGQELFVIPRGNGDGFQASVRGHILDLIDPSSYALAPTPDDLFVVSIACSIGVVCAELPSLGRAA